MDIKDKISSVVEKITSDKDLVSQFQQDPVKTVEGVAGVDLPNDAVDKVVSLVKSKISADGIADKASDALGALKKLF